MRTGKVIVLNKFFLGHDSCACLNCIAHSTQSVFDTAIHNISYFFEAEVGIMSIITTSRWSSGSSERAGALRDEYVQLHLVFHVSSISRRLSMML